MLVNNAFEQHVLKLLPTIATLAILLSHCLASELHAQPFGRMWARFLPRAPAEVKEETIDGEAADVTLPEDGDLKRKFEVVRRQLQTQKYADATRQIGNWLQDPRTHDFFLSRNEERRDGASFKAELRRLLKELPADGRAVYLAQFEAVARQRLVEAVVRGDESSLRAVLLGFPGTLAAEEAQYRLGRFLADHGRPYAAAMCLSRLRSDIARDAATSRFEPALSLLIATCWQRSGESQQAEQVLRELSARGSLAELQVAGRSTRLPSAENQPLTTWLAATTGSTSTGTIGDGSAWGIYRGDVARNRSVPAAAPFLASRWRHSVSEDVGTLSSIGTAMQANSDGQRVRLPMLHPLVIGQLVLIRTARGIRAIDHETGVLRWHYPSDDDGANAGLEHTLWTEPAGGAFSADSERFYLLEHGQPNADAEVASSGFNTLVACDLSGGREGNVRWRTGGSDGGAEPQLAGTRFLGPPVSWHERLYIIGEAKGAVWLFVLAGETGRLFWSQELAVVREEDESSAFRRMAGAVPSISADETIVCPTSGGAVVALDLTTQTLLWAYRYPRKIRTVTNPQEGVQPRLDQEGRWIDATVTIADGRVLATPLESDELHCLNLSDGRPLWTRKRGDDLYLACVAAGNALLVGRREITAVKLADGKPAWPKSQSIPEGGRPSGRGVFAGEHYFLPTTAAEVVQLSLAEGHVAGRFKSLREAVPGNLVWHNGLFVSQGGVYLEAFDELASLTTRVTNELAQNPHNAQTLLRQGELTLHAGRVDEALSHFRRACAAAPGPRMKSALVAALLDALRANPSNRDELSAELDRLIESR